MKLFPVGVFSAILTCGFFGFFATTSAASLYIDPGQATLNRGDSLSLAVRLDTDEAQGECVNAVDAIISYSENIQPVDVTIGESIFYMWVERPVINTKDRTITFAGGIPNGYCGRVIGDPRLTNVLAEIIFRSPGFSISGGSDNLTATIDFAPESTAYLNDGQGTKAQLNTYGSIIQMSDRSGATQQNPWQAEVNADVFPPEEFSIFLEKDAVAFSQKFYIVFNTTDKQTGIDQYQVMEEPLTQFGSFQWGRADAPWLTVRSPYVLKDQSLNSIVRVRALDKAGNEYIATYIPDSSMRTLSQSQVLTIAVVACVVVVLLLISVVAFVFVRRKRARRKADLVVEVTTDIE